MSQTSDCGADVAAYVLGALDANEVPAFERHLSGCSVCQAEVESLSQTVRLLPMAAPQYPASKDLRRRVIRSVRVEAEREHRSNLPQLGRNGVPRYSPGRSFRPGLVYGVAALVLVLAVVIAGVTAAGSGTKAKGPEVVSASTGNGEVIVRAHSGELVVHKLPKLGRGWIYEVWLEHAGGKPQATTALFNTGSNGDGDVIVNRDLKGYNKLLVTRERAPAGSAKPTTPVVVSVQNI